MMFFTICECDADPLEIRASTQAGGYVPGQTIQILIEVTNAGFYDVYFFNVMM